MGSSGQVYHSGGPTEILSVFSNKVKGLTVTRDFILDTREKKPKGY